MENAVKHVLSLRGENSNWDAKLGFMQKAYYVTLTQWVYTAALLSAQFARRVDWRQINYLVRGAWDIRMLAIVHTIRPRPESKATLLNLYKFNIRL